MTPILSCDLVSALRLLSSSFAGTFDSAVIFFDSAVIFCKIEFE